MRVLVTGAAGFIGSHVVESLSEQHGVVGIDDLSTGEIRNLADLDIDFIEGSILDEAALRAAVEGVDSIVHLAARPSVPRSIEDPVATHEANTVGTLRVLEAARASAVDIQVIVASSSSVYGSNPTLPKHEGLAMLPLSPYAASKLATEQYALAWQKSFGLRTLAFRFFNVYGPRQSAGHSYAAVIPAFTDAALRSAPIPIHGDGLQSRDFTYVKTVAEVITQAVDQRTSHDTPINLAYGTRTNLLDIVDRLETLVGRPLERIHSVPRPGDVAHSQASNDLLRMVFPSVVPIDLDRGLRATVNWMRSALGDDSTPIV